MALGSKVRLATSFCQRARGLLGSEDGQMLLIAPCSDVHTFGMKYPIDIAFVDSSGTVTSVVVAVPPGRRLKGAGAAAVLERRASNDPWFAPGDGLAVIAAVRDER